MTRLALPPCVCLVLFVAIAVFVGLRVERAAGAAAGRRSPPPR